MQSRLSLHCRLATVPVIQQGSRQIDNVRSALSISAITVAALLSLMSDGAVRRERCARAGCKVKLLDVKMTPSASIIISLSLSNRKVSEEVAGDRS